MVMQELPYCQEPYSKKNWGNPNHSLCSYQGKLKPAIANFLVQTFVPKGGRVLDPFSGVGTIPFEAALNGKESFGIDISPLAYYVSSAKVHLCNSDNCANIIDRLSVFIQNNHLSDEYIQINSSFGYNKTLKDYYEPNTFNEILSARQFFQQNPPKTADEFLVISCLLHVLHGNRPYALSRKSHPIVPYAPSGDFVYKSLVEKVTEKVNKSLKVEIPRKFHEGMIFLGDSTQRWDDRINYLDAIITSPPFFDSTKFYMANWIRLWFTGWNENSFEIEPKKYVDEKQKESFDIYDSIFENARERLKNGGYFVMHLGKSDKCNMGEILRVKAYRYFRKAKLYSEDVTNTEKFGIVDIGSVSEHQYLVIE
jgi:hypothetical protein